MAFDTQAARKAGYSDDEIADYLSSQSGFDAAAARKAGYSSGEIIQAISTRTTQPANDAKPDQGLTPLDTEQVTSARPWQGAGAGRGSPNDPRRLDVEPRQKSGSVLQDTVLPEPSVDPEANRQAMLKSSAPDSVMFSAGRAKQKVDRQIELGRLAKQAGYDSVPEFLQAQADAERRKKFAEENPNVGALASGSAQAVRGAINAIPAAAGFLNKAVVDPVLGLVGAKMPDVPTAPGTEQLGRMADEFMPAVGKLKLADAWDKGLFGDWLAANVSAQAPQIAQSMYGVISPGAVKAILPAMGAQATGSSFAEGDDPRVAVAKGVVEMLSEGASFGVAEKVKTALQGLAPAAQQSVFKTIAQKSLAMGGALTAQQLAGAVEESVAQLGGNALDIYASGKQKEMLEGVPEAAVIGAAVNTGMALPNVVDAARSNRPQDRAARALADTLNSGEFDRPQVETLNPNLAIQRKTQDGLINIGAAQTVDEAIAAATQATSPQDRAVDNIARILGETPDVSQPGDVRPMDSGSPGLGAPEPGIGVEAGVGTDGAAGRTLDAGRVPDQPDRGAAPLADRGPDAQLSPDVAGTTARIRELEGSTSTPEMGRTQSPEPASMWFGRRGDGYQTPEDASAALPSRQRVAPDLSWKVEQMPSGRYRLAGYDTQAQQPAPAFQVKLNPTGTATIIGDPAAIKTTLAQAGIDKVMAGTDRVVVGTSQAQAAVQALEQKQPPALVNTAQPAIESVANDQNNPTREDTQAQAPAVEAPAPAGSDAPGAAAVPATAGAGVGVEAAGVGRITNDTMAPAGTTIVDSDGRQYRVHSHRHDTIVAHPIVDGKPQVSRDTTVRFWTNPDPNLTPPGDNDRQDPVFVAPNPPKQDQTGGTPDVGAGVSLPMPVAATQQTAASGPQGGTVGNADQQNGALNEPNNQTREDTQAQAPTAEAPAAAGSDAPGAAAVPATAGTGMGVEAAGVGKQSRGPAASEAWKNEGKTPADLMAERVDGLGKEFAGTLTGAIQEEDFDPKEVSAGIRMWAEEQKVPADDLRAAVLKHMGGFDIPAGQAKKIRAALAPTNPPKQDQTGGTPDVGAGVSQPMPVAAPDPRLIPVSQRNLPKKEAELSTSAEPAQETPETAQVGPYGRDMTPIAQGGKPFKNKAEADKFRTSTSNTLKTVRSPTGKGFAVMEKSAAEILRAERSAKRLRQPNTGTAGEPLHAHGFIAAEGGLSKAAMKDAGFDRNKRVGNRWMFSDTGMTIERATEKLIEAGYLRDGASHSDAFTLLNRSANQTPQYTPEGWERMAEAEQEARRLAAQDEANADAQDFAKTAKMLGESELDELDYAVDNMPELFEAGARLTAEEADAIFEEHNANNESAVIEGDQELEQADARAAPPSRGQGDRAPGRTQEGQGSAEEGLTAPTQADVLAQQDRAAQAEELDQRAQIDREASGFQLQTQTAEQRRENTGDMFGGPSVEDAERAREADRKAQAEAQAKRDEESGQAPMFSRTPAWRSDLRDKLAEAKMEASKEEGWRAFIGGLKTKGVKPDEIEWSGVTDWLKLQTGRVTKQQVLDYLDGNGVQVQEVVNSDDPSALKNWPGDKPLPANTKYSQYTLPGGPLSRDTEILSRDGWLRMDEVQVGDVVMTRRDDDGALEWQEVEAVPTVHAEKLYHFKNQSINMRVTACHNMLVKKRRRSRAGLVRVKADELWKMSEMVAPLSGTWTGSGDGVLYGADAGDVAELIGWYIAEGSAVRNNGKKSTLSIAQSRTANPEKCARIEALLTRLGVSWNFVASGPSYYLSIKTMDRGLVDVLHAQGDSRNKFVPGFMFEQPAPVLARLMEGMLLGDGCRVKQAGRLPRWTYHTNSKQLADDMQVLALMTGSRGTISRRANGLYTVATNAKQWASIDDAKHAVVDYNDTAFCVTVQNHAIYVRTDGVAAFTGNSNYREVLLTLPEAKYSAQPKGEIVEDGKDNDFPFAIMVDGEEVNRSKTGGDVAQDILKEEIERLANKVKRSKQYKSSHWDTPNVLAHIRLNDRTDADGKRVLFVEEIQSDFGQDTKKQRDAINRAVDDDFTGIIERMKKAGVLQVECD